MDLQDDHELSASPVVANCRMNRERELTGGNSYSRDLGFDPVEFLKSRLQDHQTVRWLDLCCGQGRALIEAAGEFLDEPDRVEIIGVDLVGMFESAGFKNLRLIVSSLEDWAPPGHFDLVTCVHGLHYVGDKLATIARAVSWLTIDGSFVAHLDPDNLKHDRFRAFGRQAIRHLREKTLQYDSRRRLIRCDGRAEVSLPWDYVGADDQAGPNFTGQPAVNSWYADRAS